MKAIFTKYHGPGNVRGSRISATDGENRVYISRDCAISATESHKDAAMALCRKMDWKGRLIMGDVVESGKQTGYVFVWANDEAIEVPDQPPHRGNCGECLMEHVEIVPLNADGSCSCCAAGHKQVRP